MIPPVNESQKTTLGWEALVDVDTLPEVLHMFSKCVLKMDQSKRIEVPVNIGLTTQTKKVFIGREEVLQFLAYAEIGVVHLLIYMS